MLLNRLEIAIQTSELSLQPRHPQPGCCPDTAVHGDHHVRDFVSLVQANEAAGLQDPGEVH